jgi:hypothetical protein
MLRIISFYDLAFEDSIEIAAPPERGFAFFERMDENYTLWHPDHLRFEWRKGRGLAVGNVFFFEELIAGKLQRKETRITEVVPDRYFAFTMVNPLFRFFLPHLSFGFTPSTGGFVFRAELRLHGIGPLGRRLNRLEFAAVETHMAEEGRNLKTILEAPEEPGASAVRP